jgi:hypothetical protein
MSQRSIFRRSLILPAEHGSWSWLLVPFLLGAAVAGRLSLATLLVLGGGLSIFLVRQPATSWLRIRQGKGRRSDEPLAAGWTAGLVLFSVLSLLGLTALGHRELLLLSAPLALVMAAYLLIAWQRRARLRSLGMETAGAAGLAVMAPAAYAAGTGVLDQTGWLLWLMAGLMNALGVLYVRRRLADNRQRGGTRFGQLALHAAAFLLVTWLVWQELVPWLALLPFAGLLVRAAWLASTARPVPNIRRFGFTEVGVELAGAFLVALGYWL